MERSREGKKNSHRWGTVSMSKVMKIGLLSLKKKWFWGNRVQRSKKSYIGSMLKREEIFPDSSRTGYTWCQRRSIGEWGSKRIWDDSLHLLVVHLGNAFPKHVVDAKSEQNYQSGHAAFVPNKEAAVAWIKYLHLQCHSLLLQFSRDQTFPASHDRGVMICLDVLHLQDKVFCKLSSILWTH